MSLSNRKKANSKPLEAIPEVKSIDPAPASNPAPKVVEKEEIDFSTIEVKELPKTKSKEEIKQTQEQLSPKQAPIIVMDKKEFVEYPKTQAIVNIDDKKNEAQNQMELYKFVVASILDETDYQTTKNKKGEEKTFIIKTGVRKIMLAFNISAKIVEYKVWIDERGIYQAIAKAIAITPNGRFMESLGACSQNEKNRERSMHDTLATAETRAKSRAGLDLCGLGTVSYEEMEG